MKEAFNLARRLHEAGYAAEVHLGGREPANLRWTVDIRKKALFLLTDRASQQRFELKTTDEVLNLLRKA